MFPDALKRLRPATHFRHEVGKILIRDGGGIESFKLHIPERNGHHDRQVASVREKQSGGRFED
jgi:hypothetical protein